MFTFNSVVHAIAFWSAVSSLFFAACFIVYLQVFDWVNGYIDAEDPIAPIFLVTSIGTAFACVASTFIERIF